MCDLSEVEVAVLPLFFLLMFDSAGVNNSVKRTPEVFHINKNRDQVIIYDLREVALFTETAR
jgi:hypothetical protein